MQVLLFTYNQSDAKYLTQFKDVNISVFAMVCSFFTGVSCWAIVAYKKLSFSMDVP